MKIVRSQHAHALIKAIDLTKARKVPGVVDVFCARTIGIELPHIPIRLLPMEVAEQSLQTPIASDRVRYVGEPVAVVVASAPSVAEDAVERVAVDYEPLRAIAQSADALRRGGPRCVAVDYTVTRGDIDEAFRNANYVRALHFSTGRLSAVPLEPRGLVVWQRRDELHLYGVTKVPFFNRLHLARAFKLPASQVMVHALDVGGSFGVRGELYPEDYLAVAASRRAARPIKWIEQRSEHFAAANQSRQIDCQIEIAARSDGRILALRTELSADLGAYVRTNGIVVPAKAVQFLPGPYRIAAFAARVRGALTHKTPVGTYRGPGRSEANFIRERTIDVMCDDLGLDPFEARLLNLVRPSDMPFAMGELVPGEPSTAYDNGDYPSALDRLRTLAGHAARSSKASSQDWAHGFGIACFNDSSGGGLFEHARIGLDRSGKINAAVGSTDFGQGLATTAARLCSEHLQVAVDDVSVHLGETTRIEDGVGSFHGRSTFMGGSALVRACARFKELALERAALRLNAPVAAVHYAAGRFQVGHDPRSTVTWRDLAHETALVAEARFEQPELTFSYGAHAALVAIDRSTGEIRLVKYWAVEDFGAVLNPTLVEGLVLGGIAQGIGDALHARIVHQADSGQLLTASTLDYALPRATDIPPIELEFLSGHPSSKNPLGVKGAGEGGIAGVAAAVGNAVADALGEIEAIVCTPIQPHLRVAGNLERLARRA